MAGIAVLRLHPHDPVAVAIRDLEAGERLEGDGFLVEVHQRIPSGHKVALLDIGQGEDVLKYGEIIGHMTQPVGAGHHVHIHNLVGNRLG
jgi:altronate hydrolase